MDKLAQPLDKLVHNLKVNTTPSTCKYDCPQCRDTEIILVQQDGEDRARYCACHKRKSVARMIKSSGLTDMLREKTFDNFNVTPTTREAFNACRKYATDYPQIRHMGNNGIGLLGTVGSGKTHLLAAVANSLLFMAVPVCFVNSSDFIAELRRAQFDDTLDRKTDMAMRTDALILDDLGKERYTDWVRERYYMVINHRYLYKLPTMFSSNQDLDTLARAENLGDATASRLYSMTKGRLVHVAGEDYRMREERPCV